MINQQFRRELEGLGVLPELMGFLVEHFGPAPAPAREISSESAMSRPRGKDRQIDPIQQAEQENRDRLREANRSARIIARNTHLNIVSPGIS